jgi:hypothetical protein
MKLLKSGKIDVLVKNESSENRMVTLFGAFIDGISTVNSTQQQTYSAVSGLEPYCFVYSSQTGYLYTAGNNNIYIYDSEINLISTVAIGFIASVLFINPVNGELLIGDSVTNSVTRFDLGTNLVLGTFLIGVGVVNPNPTSVTFNPANGLLYFASATDQNIAYVNATTYAFVGDFSTVFNVPCYGVFFPPTGSTYYAPNFNGLGILGLDVTNSNIGIAVAGIISAIIYNPQNQLLYATDFDSNICYISNGTSIISSTYLPYSQPQTMLYNTNDNCIYIFFNGSNVIGKFDKDLNLIQTFSYTNSVGYGNMIIANNEIYILSESTDNIYKLGYSNNISIDGNSLAFVNTDVAYNPIKIDKAHINCSNLSQFANTIFVKEKLMTGWETASKLTPITYYSAYNSQNVIDLNFSDNDSWMFDGNRYLEFLLNANTYIQLTFYFKQFRNDEFLKINKNR